MPPNNDAKLTTWLIEKHEILIAIKTNVMASWSSKPQLVNALIDLNFFVLFYAKTLNELKYGNV